ncbi:MAG: hypothetical protein ACO1N9_06335 [Flavobacterium sp.]
MKDEIHNVLSGKIAVRYGMVILAGARYIRNGEAAGRNSEDEKYFKRQDAERLKHYFRI